AVEAQVVEARVEQVGEAGALRDLQIDGRRDVGDPAGGLLHVEHAVDVDAQVGAVAHRREVVPAAVGGDLVADQVDVVVAGGVLVELEVDVAAAVEPDRPVAGVAAGGDAVVQDVLHAVVGGRVDPAGDGEVAGAEVGRRLGAGQIAERAAVHAERAARDAGGPAERARERAVVPVAARVVEQDVGALAELPVADHVAADRAGAGRAAAARGAGGRDRVGRAARARAVAVVGDVARAERGAAHRARRLHRIGRAGGRHAVALLG